MIDFKFNAMYMYVPLQCRSIVVNAIKKLKFHVVQFNVNLIQVTWCSVTSGDKNSSSTKQSAYNSR